MQTKAQSPSTLSEALQENQTGLRWKILHHLAMSVVSCGRRGIKK